MSTAPPKPLSQGLHPKVSSEPKAVTDEIDIDYNAALKKFFESYAPEKVPDTESYLQKYRGKEAEVRLTGSRFSQVIHQIVNFDYTNNWI